MQESTATALTRLAEQFSAEFLKKIYDGILNHQSPKAAVDIMSGALGKALVNFSSALSESHGKLTPKQLVHVIGYEAISKGIDILAKEAGNNG